MKNSIGYFSNAAKYGYNNINNFKSSNLDYSSVSFGRREKPVIDDYDRYMIQKVKQGTLMPADVNQWYNTEYNKIRKVNLNNIVQNPYLQNVIDYPQVRGINIENQGGWKYRSAENFFPEKDRASLNVINHPGLINELDYFMKTGQYNYCGFPYKVNNLSKFYYKTYADASKWYIREDPVSLYFNDKLNDETYLALVQITAKYRNNALHNAEGEMADWFKKEQSPDKSMIIPLIQDAQKVNNTLAEFIYRKSYNSANGNYVLSSGVYEAFSNIINKIKKEKSHFF